MTRQSHIYALEYPVNNIRYVGKTVNLDKRYNSHLNSWKRTKVTHKNNWIKSLLAKGEKPLMTVIDSVNEGDANFWECYYIALIKSWGFKLTNGTHGGDGLDTSREDVKRQISASLRKYFEKHPVWNKGKKLTPEECSVYRGIKGKVVIQFTLDGKFVRKWRSARLIKDTVGYDNTAIGKCCDGRSRYSHGYLWLYEKDLDEQPDLLERRLKLL